MIWPFNRKKKASSKRAYAGATYSRLVADWITSNASADAEIRGSLTRLRDRSRQLNRDNDYVRSAKRTIRINVVGQGIGLQSQVRMKRGKKTGDKAPKLNEPLNDRIESAWSKWQRKENCDAAGKLCFSDIERLIIDTVFEAGEVIVRKISQRMGNSKVPLALELIEPDLLDENYTEVLGGGNYVRMGVEMNQWGRPVAYHFLAKHPGDVELPTANMRRGDRIRVPASEIMHLFVAERIRQTRGVPWLAAAMMRLRHMHGYEEAEVIAARASASLMGFIESPDGQLQGDDVMNGDRVTEFEPGVFKQLNPGEKVNIPNLSRPGGQFDPFMRSMIRGFVASVGASYESVSRDYSQSNYSSSRLALLDDRDHWKVLQKWLIENFHQPLFEAWMDLAVLSGEIEIPDYFGNEDSYRAPRWMPRGWSWVDPAKEVAAYKEAELAGYVTKSDVIAQGGGDFEETMLQRKREKDRAKELGLEFDTDSPKKEAPAFAKGKEKPAGEEEGEEKPEPVSE